MFQPIDSLHGAFMETVTRHPVVLSAPTGSGKSTQIPRWLRTIGRVLVVEPRRVACQALASRVAELEGATLGQEVGYIVRDDRRVSANTEIVFATPGVVLRMLRDKQIHQFSTLVLDEFHERSLDLDLIGALVVTHGGPRLVVMSATLHGDSVARWLNGVHLQGDGRQFPVSIKHIAEPNFAPSSERLVERVRAALKQSEQHPGHALIFLPGKSEIYRVQQSLSTFKEWEILPLHGGLSLPEQSRIFSSGKKRRALLSTNVAETSLTVPGIGVVIDSGLVRRTQYHQGRGYLTLMAIAADSADQRAGRAGRLGPGICYRLWSSNSQLEAHTPPEIHRESLVSMILAARACSNKSLDNLQFLDPPHAYALEDAETRLRGLSAIDDAGSLTRRGEQLFGLPLEPHLGRLLIEAQSNNTLHMIIPLAATLQARRAIFKGIPEDPDENLRAGGCDAMARIAACTIGNARTNLLDRDALKESRRIADRMTSIWPHSIQTKPVQRKQLAMTLMAAWPDCAHVARRRKRNVAWSNGGTELQMATESAVDEYKTSAVLVMESRAFGMGRKRRLIITAAMPIPLSWMAEADLGEARVAAPIYKNHTVYARIEQVYAGQVLDRREEIPQGELARIATRDLFLQGVLFPEHIAEAQRRHDELVLAHQITQSDHPATLSEWVENQLLVLGLENGSDVQLLSPQDLMPPTLPAHQATELRKHYPPTIVIADVRYRVSYDLIKKEATLFPLTHLRHLPAPRLCLPKKRGWRILICQKNRTRVVRDRFSS